MLRIVIWLIENIILFTVIYTALIIVTMIIRAVLVSIKVEEIFRKLYLFAMIAFMIISGFKIHTVIILGLYIIMLLGVYIKKKHITKKYNNFRVMINAAMDDPGYMGVWFATMLLIDIIFAFPSLVEMIPYDMPNLPIYLYTYAFLTFICALILAYSNESSTVSLIEEVYWWVKDVEVVDVEKIKEFAYKICEKDTTELNNENNNDIPESRINNKREEIVSILTDLAKIGEIEMDESDKCFRKIK